MATSRIEAILREIRDLSREQQLVIATQLQNELRGSAGGGRRSLMELRGLGKEIWEDIDVAEYVRQERQSWDG